MKLATLRRGGRDGTLVVVDRQLRHAATVPKIAHTLQEALEDWSAARPRLLDVYDRLNAGGIDTSFAVRLGDLTAPLPRGQTRLDARQGGADAAPFVVSHGASGVFLGARDPIRLADPRRVLAFRPALGALTDDVPLGVGAADAGAHVRLLVLLNDPVHEDGLGDPPSALAPVAATPDELGAAWHDHRVHRTLEARVGDGDVVPCAVSGIVDFATFVFRAARSRALGAGTILSVAAPPAPPAALRPVVGGRVRIELCDEAGQSVFGTIDQDVLAAD